MSATRPAIELSMGIIASSQSPRRTAWNASSKVGHGIGSMRGNISRQAISEFAPRSP